MAPAVLKAKHYILLILDSETTPKQAKLLLGSANKIQLLAITEIFKNILHLKVTDQPKLKRTLKRNSQLIHFLASTSTPAKHKMNLIRQSSQIVFSLIVVMRLAILSTLTK